MIQEKERKRAGSENPLCEPTPAVKNVILALIMF